MREGGGTEDKGKRAKVADPTLKLMLKLKRRNGM